MRREVSLFFATIGWREAATLLFGLLSAPFVSSEHRREGLNAVVQEHVPAAGVFAFGSARGALAACLRAAGVGPGAEVLLSSFTCLAVPTAVLAAGARPVYLDIDPETLNTPAEHVVARLSGAVRAVVVQHTLGNTAEIQAVVAAARSRGVLVIEDCALALASRHDGRPVGSFGDAAIWSMELSKMLTTGWGGVLAVHDPTLAQRMHETYGAVPELPAMRVARMALQTAITGVCYAPNVHRVGKYAVAALFKAGLFGASTPESESHGLPGPHFVSKLAGPQAALAEQQWRRLPQVAARCLANARYMREAIVAAGLQPLATPAPGDEAVTPRVAFLVADRPAAIACFHHAGIELGSWFDGPLSPAPANPETFNYDVDAYPNARWVARHIVNLPSHSRLAETDLNNIRQTLLRYAAAHPADGIRWP